VGALAADQLSVVEELVVPEAARPVGTLGAAEQPLPPPVTGCHKAGTFGGSHPTCEVCA